MSNLLRRTERNERARRVFNTMDALQYANLLRETIEEYGCPATFNTDQGSQFTSDVFIKVLVDYDIQISMDGKDRALDNIRIERLWRSLTYEDIYLKRYETMKDLKAGINACFNFYNTARFHQSLDYNGLMKCINASSTMNWKGTENFSCIKGLNQPLRDDRISSITSY